MTSRLCRLERVAGCGIIAAQRKSSAHLHRPWRATSVCAVDAKCRKFCPQCGNQHAARFVFRTNALSRNSYQPQGTRTESSIFDDRVASEEVVAEPVNGGYKPGPLVRAPRRINAQQDDAGDRPCLTKDQVTEILVFRQQQA